jgi:hypothetical protein
VRKYITFSFFHEHLRLLGGKNMDKSHSTNTFKKSLLSVLALAFFLVFVPGCAQYHLDMKDSDPAEKPYKGKMIHALGWGLLYQPQQITTDCNTETGINDVIVKSNYLYNLASVLTLGIWMPIEIEHRCQAAPSVEIPFDDN